MSTYYVLGCPFACIIPMQMRKPSIIMYWIWVGLKLYFRMDDIFSCSMRKSRKSTKFEIGSDGTSSIRYLAIRLSCKIYDTEYLFFYFFSWQIEYLIFLVTNIKKFANCSLFISKYGNLNISIDVLVSQCMKLYM